MSDRRRYMAAGAVAGACIGFALHAGADAWRPAPTAAEVHAIEAQMLARQVEHVYTPGRGMDCHAAGPVWRCTGDDGTAVTVRLYEDGSWKEANR